MQTKISGFTPKEQADAENEAWKEMREEHPELANQITPDKTGRYTYNPDIEQETHGPLDPASWFKGYLKTDPRKQEQSNINVLEKDMRKHQILMRKQQGQLGPWNIQGGPTNTMTPEEPEDEE